MYAFEKDICTLLDENNVVYGFDEEEHTLHSEQLKIKFIPNLSGQVNLSSNQRNDQQIVLWEDIYHTRRVQVNSRIKSLLGLNKRIHGRETIIKEINKRYFHIIMKINHI